jgi:hypothetical protein
MLSSRALRVAAFVSLAATSVFWFWVVASLLAVHWPANGQNLVAAAFLLAGMGIVGYGLISTLQALLGGAAHPIATVILEGLSIASLLIISGGVELLVFLGVVFLLTPLDFLLLAVGLAGSLFATLSYERVRSRGRAWDVHLPPVPPGPSGDFASVG